MSAILSPCEFHRYRLDRLLGDGPSVALIGVNPATADARINDQTIRKDMGFARLHGWGRIIKANKFSYRAKDVRELARCAEPNGPEADAYLRAILAEADQVVACWGPLSKLPRPLRQRWLAVLAMAREAGKPLWCFGTAQDGQPRHTLMLAYETPLTIWRDA